MASGAYRFADFSMYPPERLLFEGGRRVALQPKAFDALHLLVRHHGSLVSRDEIMRRLWPGVHVTEANLTNIVVQLRKLIGRDAIQTVSKFGYRFTVPVVDEPGVRQTAYASFVRGKELIAERSPESISNGRDLLLLSLAEDPQFAAAWAWLGRCCRLLEKLKGEPSASPSLAEAAFRRAFSIDPDLACAHQFYTQLQVDSGQAAQAMTRLASRLRQRGEDPETLAGLVQVLRCCGLLEESAAAHDRALALDPTIRTSVAHTHFLRGDYARVFETYTGKGYYLDAASWAALGNVDRAAMLLRDRLPEADMGPLMRGLIASLLAVLEGRGGEAIAIMDGTEVFREPEMLFYFGRHCAMLNAETPAVHWLRRARLEGFTASWTLERDPAFAGLRSSPAFAVELWESKLLETEFCGVFPRELARRLDKGAAGTLP